MAHDLSWDVPRVEKWHGIPDPRIGSMAHDLPWRQEEPRDEYPDAPVCAICGEELTDADKEYGAEAQVDMCPEFGEHWAAICIPCSKKAEATIWIPSPE